MLNWVDFLIILVLLFYAIEGAGIGFYTSFLDLLSFVVSFGIGLTFYSFFGKIVASQFSMPPGFANAIGFFAAAFLSELVFNLILRGALHTSFFPKPKVPYKLTKALDNLLGASTSVFSGIVLASFILTMVIALPLSTFLKSSVSNSKIGSVLTKNTQGLAKNINDVFGGAVNESLSFLTVKPQSNELVNLNFKTSEFRVDEVSERQMFIAVNNERSKRGIKPLSVGPLNLTIMARRHCEDMLRRGYFSHYTPEGLSPFDRMVQGGVSFTFAAENLALAPNVDLAMQGLMQSEGHRENILSSSFGRLSVGVIDAGIYGQMYCQEFID